MRARRVITLVSVMSALAVAGCTGSSEAPTPELTSGLVDPLPSETAEPVPDLSEGRTVEISGVEVHVALGPLVREGDAAVLPMTVEAPDATSDMQLNMAFVSPFVSGIVPSALRLVDAERREVHPVAVGDGRAVGSRMKRPGGEPLTVYAAFAAPAADTVDVLVPYVGYVDGVAVVDADNEGAPPVPSVTELADGASELTFPVLPLEAYTEDLGGAVRTLTEQDQVTVAISTDVLFAFDSADLGSDADEALRAAGAQLAESGAGQITVVGHTDDQGDAAYNQELSVRRAQAVADRLAQVVDMSGYSVVVEGRGMTEPALEGKTSDARAANRRVELRFEPGQQSEPSSEVAHEIELPEPQGPVASGRDGVVVEFEDQGELRISLTSARRIDGFVVGELVVERLSGEGRIGRALASGTLSPRGAMDTRLLYAASNLTLLSGTTRLYAVDYVADDIGRRDPLADTYLAIPFRSSQAQTVTVVWPDPGGETAVLDAPQQIFEGRETGGPPFRLTDIPIED